MLLGTNTWFLKYNHATFGFHNAKISQGEIVQQKPLSHKLQGIAVDILPKNLTR